MADSPTQRSNAGSPEANSDASGKKSRQGDSPSRVGSGRVTFPTSAKSINSDVTTANSELVPSDNPFKMPADNDIFMLRDKERQRKKQERLRQRSLKVHEKTTYASRVNFRTAAMIRPAEYGDDKEDEDNDKAVAVKDDPQFTIAVTKDRHVEKESLAEYIAKKREMFLVQYSLGVKRDEMRKLEEIAQAEERKLELAEQYLEEDAAMFDEFLKENDKNSVEAIKIAEQETKLKLEKVAEIKKLNAQMMSIKSEISKYEDTLKEFQLYRKFLESLTPPEYREEREKERQKRKEQRKKDREAEKVDSGRKLGDDASKTDLGSKKSQMTKKSLKLVSPASGGKGGKPRLSKSGDLAPVELESSDDDSDEIEALVDLELFFQDPSQLLDIFAELEEQNLSLIQNSQETEEALEEMKQNVQTTKAKMERETQILQEQIDKLTNQIVKEEAKAAELKIKAKLFNYGEFKAEDQEKMLAALNKKVEEVYRSTIGDNEANISTLQMLTNIENRLEDLFEQIEQMPQDKVEAAEKAKEKERRMKLREEKLEQQRIHQEERVRRALERAKAEPKKKTGKKLVFRSEPPRLRKKEDEGADQASKEEEELAYFFQW